MADGDVPRALSAKYEGDFAYPTVKDRLPVILTKAVDTVYRLKAEVSESFGEEGTEDLKSICSQLSKLKNELQTDKAIIPLEVETRDTPKWNEYLEKLKSENDGNVPSWFKSPWLYSECYFYRRINQAIQMSNRLQSLDPFRQQKQEAFETSMNAILILINHLYNVPEESVKDEKELKHSFVQFLELSLWGNKCDLSISASLQNSQETDPLIQIDTLRESLLIDHSEYVWNTLQKAKKNKDSVRVDIVVDNAGFELFTDMCLAELLIDTGAADQVRFHGKAMPWFVSDVTQDDWDWTMEQVATADDEVLCEYGRKWLKRLIDRIWVFEPHDFWTMPHDFSEMEAVAPDLYKDLSNSDLVLFKGDLNYRKLTGDLKWDFTTPFKKALRGFHPAPLAALRTLKCDLCVGLAPGQADEIASKDKNWMLTGSYAVLQYHGY